jgi:Dyp-type peroxidase family
MAVDLRQPLTWTTAKGDASTMLDQLQPNILKPHVRDRLSVLLVQFGDAATGRAFLSGLVKATDPALMKSARAALEETLAFKESGQPGTPYVGVGLSFAGYKALEIERAKTPSDPSFRRGMRAAATLRTLTDPPVSKWEEAYQDEIHAIVLIGDKTAVPMQRRRREILARLRDSATVLWEEHGRPVAPGHRNIEHFGYVDGVSQPLFLTEDIDAERAKGATKFWDPAFPLEQVLVAEPSAPATRFGSYLVFRKLEQNVQLFKGQEELMGCRLGLSDEDSERAGAMLVGRFEDGTPVTLEGEAGLGATNDFTYEGDSGLKCPHYAHVRKVNPRRPVARRHLMARRGQTYGLRTDEIEGDDVSLNERPTAGVGLLFMAFNSSLREQFEHTQKRFANHATRTSAADPLIGQGPRGKLISPVKWGEPKTKATDAIAQAVTMKGGEYFFMPSLPFLRDL